MMNVNNRQRPWLEHQAQFHPERSALISGDRSYTFSELFSQARLIAGELNRRRVSAGDYVGVISPNSPEQFLLFHALLLLGAVIVPINHKLTGTEIESMIRKIDLQVVISAGELELSSAIHPAVLSIDSLFKQPLRSEPLQPAQISSEEICAIFFTSGTTGDPKPVPLTHDNFFYSAMGSALNIGVTSRDNWLLCLPMDHMGGFSIFMRSLVYGTSVTLLPSFSPKSVLQQFDDSSITHISLVPTMLNRLLKHAFSVPASLRAILLGGGPAEIDLVSEALERGLPLLRTYGLTEACSQVTTTPLDEVEVKTGSSGKPLAFVDVRIADEDGSPKPTGETGEIFIRGNTITPGYLDNQHENDEKFVDGWFRTGDYGYMDHEGFLFTLSRKDDVIISGGEKILPGEVESALLNNSHIEDVCVFGVPDSEWGEKIVAAIVLHESAAEFHPEDIAESAEL
ncbi:MAG: o-succinylbenzoate--CoA ligase, partial [Candidatus Marinimicrobia bacterium]|nr:o-succinylbenzoate--CoA ligase [Candidatus Neomarinimicrobiota bacterium]